MAFLEGLTLATILSDITASYVGKRLDQSGQQLVDTLKSGELPRNHHIQRAVRKCFLRASIHQLLEYERDLEAGDDYNQQQTVFAARKQLQWANLKTRWVRVELPEGLPQIAAIDAALDEIAGTHDALEKLGTLPEHLTNLALQEICAHTPWETCPEPLEKRLHTDRVGWFGDFAAHMAQEFKTNTEFQRIQQALQLRAMDGFQKNAHEETSKRLEEIATSLGGKAIDESQIDRVLNSMGENTSAILNSLRDAPFGRRYVASQTSEMVQLRLNNLTEFFAGRDDDFKNIDTLVDARMAGRNNGLIVLTAPAGFGKSALAAAWCEYAKANPNRDLAIHFCSASQFAEETTHPTKILDHLWAQVAAAYGKTPDMSAPEDGLIETLQAPPPEGRELVIWLDGLDEAQGDIRPFLPPANKLGDRVCLVISARADPGTTPRYLAPWLSGEWAQTYGNIPVHTLEKLSLEDVSELCCGVFENANLTVPDRLPENIYQASENGYAIFVRYMIEDAARNLSAGQSVDLGESPLSLSNYAKTELDRLEAAPNWNQFEHIFDTLTVVNGSIDLATLRQIHPNKPRLNVNALPPELARWLSISPEKAVNKAVGFAHPKLAMVFRDAIESMSDGRIYEVLTAISQNLETTPSAMSDYALSNLPFHQIEAGDLEKAAALLMEEDFIAERYQRFGTIVATDLMRHHWERWQTAHSSNLSPAPDSISSRHHRFWANFSETVKIDGQTGPKNIWRQLMADMDFAIEALPPKLSRPDPTLLPQSVATLKGHSGSVSGAIKTKHGHFLSWSEDNTLRLWSPDGAHATELKGHSGWVRGAIETKHGHFLSWSQDNTLRLWSPDGAHATELKGHSGPVSGAIETKHGHFLSWSEDNTLRLWSPDGAHATELKGHSRWVSGAIETKHGHFLSWSSDNTLRLWSPDGAHATELKGHSGWVSGAIETKHGHFLSWGYGSTLRLWSPDGAHATELKGHTGWVSGAIETKHGHFLSWSEDSTLRLWSPDGAHATELKGHSGWVRGAIETKHGHFLSWSEDSTLRLWSNNGRTIWTWASPTNSSISHVAKASANQCLITTLNHVLLVQLPN